MYEMLSQRKSKCDRFIPRRSGEDFNLSYYKLNKSQNESSKLSVLENIDSSASGHYHFKNYVQESTKKKNYETRLYEIVVPQNRRILNFSERKNSQNNVNLKKPFCVQDCDWPVKPRKRPLINGPMLALDMPELPTNSCYAIDWGISGYLATIYKEEVHLWHPDKRAYALTATKGRVQNPIRWNREGSQLAMSLDYLKLGIWDLNAEKIVGEVSCICPWMCTITAIEWSPEGYILTGCTKGRIVTWKPGLRITYLSSIYPAHVGPVIILKFSCEGKYLLTTGEDGKVRFYIWAGMKEHFEISFIAPIRVVAWHPWKENLVCFGIPQRSGLVTLWDVNTQQEFMFELTIDKPSVIDALSWNPLTGELVVSNWVHSVKRSLISVLASSKIVTDMVQYHVGRVPYLLWGEDGTQLATAGADEHLCVWDFLGTSIEKKNAIKKVKAEKAKRKALTANCVENLNIFGTLIR